MDLRSLFSSLGLFSKVYSASMLLLVCGYLIRQCCLHRRLWTVANSSPQTLDTIIEEVHGYSQGLRQAQHIALGLGRALFAAQLSGLLFFFTPLMRSTDADPWFALPEFVIICQLCFLPVLILLAFDWALAIHTRHLSRRH
jgi:hypothetical protein